MDALVLGGTGPTGPYIVNGLLERGYRVTIMHGGFHEVDFAGPVEDLHGDVHFKSSLEETLGNRSFDLVVFTYGRLRETADFMIGRTGRFVAAGAGGGRPGPRDPRWGRLGRPVIDPGDLSPAPADETQVGLARLIRAANEHVMELHAAGHFNATILGYPVMYGPRQAAPEDWSVVRRILDGRRELIIADGGLKIHQRGYAENVAQAVLLAVDKPAESAGEIFSVNEQPLYTMRQRIELICEVMKADVELVDLPYPLAQPCHYLWKLSPAHMVQDDSKIRQKLGYTEVVPVDEAQIQTVEWLVANREQFGDEWNQQTEDTFEYDVEDELIRRWKVAYADLAAVRFDQRIPAHRYRHPRVPGEAWHRPEQPTSYSQRPQQFQYY